MCRNLVGEMKPAACVDLSDQQREAQPGEANGTAGVISNRLPLTSLYNLRSKLIYFTLVN